MKKFSIGHACVVVVALVTLGFLAADVSAQSVITFDALSSGSFTGAYVEAGFVVSPVIGDLVNNVRLGTGNLENVPVGPSSSVRFRIEATDSGDFLFLGLDAGGFTPGGNHALFTAGFLNGVQQFAWVTPTLPVNSFLTVNSPLATVAGVAIDRLEIVLGGGTVIEAADNVRVEKLVPVGVEASSWGGIKALFR